MRKTTNKSKKCSIVINTSFDRELYNTVALINSIKDFSKSCNLYTIYVLFYDKTKLYVKNVLEEMQTNNIKIICIMDFYEKYPDLPQVSKNLLGIFAPNFIKENTNPVLLSPNTIVQSDIADILDIYFDDKVVACCYDLYDKIIRNNDENAYFNTDVMVINAAVWKRLMLTDACVSYIEKSSAEFRFTDLINVVCCNNIKELEYEWNFQYWNSKQEFFEEMALLKLKAKIINFVDDKPWVRPMMDKADIWWKYARNNPLYEVILYRNIHCNLPEFTYVKAPDKQIENETNVNYIFFDKLKNEVNSSLLGKTGNQEILKKVMNDKDLFLLIRRYIKLSFKYMFSSRRDNIKNEMNEVYNSILSIISANQL